MMNDPFIFFLFFFRLGKPEDGEKGGRNEFC